MNTESLHVKPIHYKLDIDDEQMKKLRPFFKVSSGSYSRITKTVKHPDPKGKDPECEDEIRIRRKEKGAVVVELWDRNSSKPENLIGKGEITYSSLSSKEGQFEEWIDLFDRNNKKVGKALVEVKVTPVNLDLNPEEMFKRSIESMHKSFQRAIEDMNNSFRHFSRLLPSDLSLLPSLSSSPGQQAIKQDEKDNKQIQQQQETQKSMSTEEKNKSNQLSPQRRSWFDSTFEEMHNMFEKTLEDMHNTFEQFTKDFFPPSIANLLEDEKKGMDVEEEKPKETTQNQDEQNRQKTNKGKTDVEIREEPVKP